MKLSSSDLDSSPARWQSPPQDISLATRDVHVWRASLTQPAAIVKDLRQLLSIDEQARADRFHFEVHREHYIVGRGYLRQLLARYLNLSPETIRFAYQQNGKPEIASETSLCQLKFNLAHSGNLALYAFTGVGDIGVDLELIRPFTTDDIASQFFSATEVASLNQLPPPIRHRAFFNCWTRKEAFLKANGFGLLLALDQFDVTLKPEEPPALLSTRWDESEAARWELKAIDPGVDYVGAVAVQGHDWTLKCWEFAYLFDVGVR